MPTAVFSTRKYQDLRSLAGYSYGITRVGHNLGLNHHLATKPQMCPGTRNFRPVFFHIHSSRVMQALVSCTRFLYCFAYDLSTFRTTMAICNITLKTWFSSQIHRCAPNSVLKEKYYLFWLRSSVKKEKYWNPLADHQ